MRVRWGNNVLAQSDCQQRYPNKQCSGTGIRPLPSGLRRRFSSTWRKPAHKLPSLPRGGWLRANSSTASSLDSVRCGSDWAVDSARDPPIPHFTTVRAKRRRNHGLPQLGQHLPEIIHPKTPPGHSKASGRLPMPRHHHGL